MNIVLITPQVVGSKTQIRRVQPPLGIACLAATLLEKGYDNIKIIDAAAGGYDNIVPLDPENKFIKFGLSNDQVSIKPHNIEPKDLVSFASNLNQELALVPQMRSKKPKDKYKLLKNKETSSNRMYLSS